MINWNALIGKVINENKVIGFDVRFLYLSKKGYLFAIPKEVFSNYIKCFNACDLLNQEGLKTSDIRNIVLEEVKDDRLWAKHAYGHHAPNFHIAKYIYENNLTVEVMESSLINLPQQILQGPPGTGKSHKLTQKLRSELITQELEQHQVKRVTCHLEMTSADFIGAYQPVTDAEGKLSYRFVPGALVSLLRRALRRLDEPHVLIIEELNRANAAAMFAEAFQLLDRVEVGDELAETELGWSAYPTSLGVHVQRYLVEADPHHEESGVLDEATVAQLRGAVRLPPNFAIWATLNTADQSVFPLDTAFKRRWSFEYLGVDEHKEVWSQPAWNPIIPGYPELRWQDLRQAINERLEANEIEEDRHLGGFFLKRSELVVEGEGAPHALLTRILDKVVSYLRDDVLRADPSVLFVQMQQGDALYTPGYASLRRKALEDGLLSIFKDLLGLKAENHSYQESYLKWDDYRLLREHQASEQPALPL